MPDIRIIKAPASLRKTITDRCRETFAEHRARQPQNFPANIFEVIIAPNLEEAFLSERGQPLPESPVIFAAMDGDDMVGYIALSSWARLDPVTMPAVNIEDIWVSPKRRNEGVASALLAHVKTLSDAKDWRNLTATVWAENAASEALFQGANFAINSTAYRYGAVQEPRDLPVHPRVKGQTTILWTLVSVLSMGLLLWLLNT